MSILKFLKIKRSEWSTWKSNLNQTYGLLVFNKVKITKMYSHVKQMDEN